VASIGIDLAPLVESGHLRLHAFRGRSEAPEAHVARIRSLLQEEMPHHLVVDPISALAKHGHHNDAEAAALQVLDLAKRAGVTVVSTSLLGNPLPLTEQTPLDISTIADTWMHVSYVNQGGERNRALTIIKARGTGHSNQIRELVLSSQGVTLADVYTAGGEVLMGTLRWEKENAERRARAAAVSNATLRERKAELAIADTQAQLDALNRERLVQEAELELLKADAAQDTDRLSGEADELLLRRQADGPSSGAPRAGRREEPSR
jgi:circadian clock protein KaiC